MNLLLLLITASLVSSPAEVKHRTLCSRDRMPVMEIAFDDDYLVATSCSAVRGNISRLQEESASQESTQEGSTQEESTQEESTQEESTQEESTQEESTQEEKALVLQGDVGLAMIPAEKIDVQLKPNDASWVEAPDARLQELAAISGGLKWHEVIRASGASTRNRVPRNFELVIGTGGAEFLQSVYRIGFVEVSQFDLISGEPPALFSLPPGIPDPVMGWVFPRDERKLGGSGQRASSVFVGVQYDSPASLPMKVKTVQGSLKFKLATELEVVTIANIAETEGRLDLPTLSDREIEISIRRIDGRSIVVRMKGKLDDVADVNLLGKVADTAKSRVVIRDKVFYQFDFLSEIPADLLLQIQLVNRSRELTLPFELNDLLLGSGD